MTARRRRDTLRAAPVPAPAPAPPVVERRGFCGRDRCDVRWLLTSSDQKPPAFICDVCILLAVHALADKLAEGR